MILAVIWVGMLVLLFIGSKHAIKGLERRRKNVRTWDQEKAFEADENAWFIISKLAWLFVLLPLYEIIRDAIELVT